MIWLHFTEVLWICGISLGAGFAIGILIDYWLKK